jgi:hypothetical protein
MTMFVDHHGVQNQVQLDVSMYREAGERGQSFRQFVNAKFPTNQAKTGTAFEQFCASSGILLRNDPRTGQRASTVHEMATGTGPQMEAAAVTKEAVPASRILFPAAVLGLVEDRLAVDLTQTDTVFNGLVAYEESINGERVEQPVINYSAAGANQPQGIAQLAMPASMITITAADVAYKIPVFSQGIEVSDQAARVTTIDFVALTLARTFALQANQRAQGYMLALKDGDVDNNDGSLSSLGFASTSTSFDAAATGGVLTQKAWMSWMTQFPEKRVIDVIVTDLATAIKIEGRLGKPIITQDDPNSPRIDTNMSVLNPQWAPRVKVFLVTAGSGWPANTVMGIDSRYAIRRIRSLTASFQSTEAFITKRSTISRFDFGEIVNRMFPEAFSLLTVL